MRRKTGSPQGQRAFALRPGGSPDEADEARPEPTQGSNRTPAIDRTGALAQDLMEAEASKRGT